jgi:hypothetical protein
MESHLTKANLPAIGNTDIRVQELQETNFLWVAAAETRTIEPYDVQRRATFK